MSVLVHEEKDMVELLDFLALNIGETMFSDSNLDEFEISGEMYKIVNSLWQAEQVSYNARYNESHKIRNMNFMVKEETNVLTPIEAICRLKRIVYQIDPDPIFYLSKYTVEYVISFIAKAYNIDLESEKFQEEYEKCEIF